MKVTLRENRNSPSVTSFPECQKSGTRGSQSSLSVALREELHSGKECFSECLKGHDIRGRNTLGEGHLPREQHSGKTRTRKKKVNLTVTLDGGVRQKNGKRLPRMFEALGEAGGSRSVTLTLYMTKLSKQRYNGIGPHVPCHITDKWDSNTDKRDSYVFHVCFENVRTWYPYFFINVIVAFCMGKFMTLYKNMTQYKAKDHILIISCNDFINKMTEQNPSNRISPW
jgi:hypothetical protein